MQTTVAVHHRLRDRWDRRFVTMAIGTQVVLVIFFALRKWDFPAAMQVGWLVYALAIPAVALSVQGVREGKAWYLVAAGFLFGVWAAFGTVVDIIHRVEWRSPMLLPVFLPYVTLYIAAQMFYWWPLLKVDRRAWLAFTVLYAASTYLNMSSH